MGISVNGVEIDDRQIELELPHHKGAANPLKRSVHEVVLRTVLLQEADRLGIYGDEDTRIEALLTQEVSVPQADDAACLTYYRNHPDKFTRGEMVEARHILFQVTPTVPLDLVRETAEDILAALRAAPERFGELAAQYSNCPSGAVGGSLGQLSRGDCVPEFDDVLFRLGENEFAARPIETRFGLHIVQVLRRIDGSLLPFETVKSQIAAWLATAALQRGIHQYLQILVGRARIEGITLEGSATPLVQ
ncbi:peptidylprolyl isomerase [Telluria mixta]|uniref:peptidylprolyl isomerase n=1 Tax=Telluria mixta TaxID=34071 RepID=A0ABT2BZ73_9BURK|nr:peptidylprolyl isomerase [Telluria mixta]MCS0630443.1 peptidylprolyl isomerase [Telluria mixta]WEM94253.1 peptidylprolyl isomerase [Telluria mixta]